MSSFILYFGSDSPASTSRSRADALRRLGCRVMILDPALLIGNRNRWLAYIDYRTAFRFIQRLLLENLQKICLSADLKPSLIWVDSGELFGSHVLGWLAKYFQCPIILVNLDDPTGTRDGARFRSLWSSLHHYSLCVFVRNETSLDALALGARRVMRVNHPFDEITSPPTQNESIHPRQLIISFIGTLIPGESRDRFVLTLLNAGLPLRLIGNRWQRSRHWSQLQNCYDGPGRAGVSYARAIRSSTISLGLLSHQNRDLVTGRSFEVPASRGLLCAERTSEHQLFYEDGQEAIFWDSTEECISRCWQLLANPQWVATICETGFQRVYQMGVSNEDICRQILAAM